LILCQSSKHVLLLCHKFIDYPHYWALFNDTAPSEIHLVSCAPLQYVMGHVRFSFADDSRFNVVYSLYLSPLYSGNGGGFWRKFLEQSIAVMVVFCADNRLVEQRRAGCRFWAILFKPNGQAEPMVMVSIVEHDDVWCMMMLYGDGGRPASGGGRFPPFGWFRIYKVTAIRKMLVLPLTSTHHIHSSLHSLSRALAHRPAQHPNKPKTTMTAGRTDFSPTRRRSVNNILTQVMASYYGIR
jgi:hypothetical protein